MVDDHTTCPSVTDCLHSSDRFKWTPSYVTGFWATSWLYARQNNKILAFRNFKHFNILVCVDTLTCLCILHLWAVILVFFVHIGAKSKIHSQNKIMCQSLYKKFINKTKITVLSYLAIHLGYSNTQIYLELSIPRSSHKAGHFQSWYLNLRA